MTLSKGLAKSGFSFSFSFKENICQRLPIALEDLNKDIELSHPSIRPLSWRTRYGFHQLIMIRL